ncbi:MAG TPA: VWA domain-containing protein, partial [Pyrinomonadaceae bacterium]|nr:VWA domain-containing protein [Pyrinomonadaceae bacterium]
RVPPKGGEKQNTRPEPLPTPTPKPAEAPELQSENVPDSGEVVSVDTRLVTIPVRVMDRRSRFIGGIKQESFKVFEDDVEQDVAYFTNESQPFTVALVLDMSYSTTFKITEIQQAAISFIDQLRPEDRVMVISFDEQVHVLCEATSDRATIYRAIRSTKIATGTSLYEAVDKTINDRLRTIKGRKAMVLFTDGVDTTSRYSNDMANLRDALELDTLIYPIRYDTYADVQAMKKGGPIMLPGPKTTTPPTIPTSGGKLPFPIPTGPTIATAGDKGTTPEEYKFAEEYLTKLADLTGGSIYLASTVGNLNNAFTKIASELREFYSLGYYPTSDETPGKTRRIKVKVDRPDVVVRARDRYVVPKKKRMKTS